MNTTTDTELLIVAPIVCVSIVIIVALVSFCGCNKHGRCYLESQMRALWVYFNCCFCCASTTETTIKKSKELEDLLDEINDIGLNNSPGRGAA